MFEKVLFRFHFQNARFYLNKFRDNSDLITRGSPPV